MADRDTGRYPVAGSDTVKRFEQIWMVFALIVVTRLNGTSFVINSDLIETIEEAPDTIISLTNKSKYVVKERIDDIIDEIVRYKHRVNCRNFGGDLNDPSFKN